MSCCDCETSGLPQCEPTGYISTHGAYFSPSPNIDAKDEHSERAILLLTDDPFQHSRILADNLALRLDCDVWVPDYFQGPPLNIYPHPDLRRWAGAYVTVCRWIKSKLHRVTSCVQNRPSMIDARLSRFIKALREEKDYLKIGAIGYCSGGSTATRLASTDWIQSVVVCHPRKLKIPEVQAIKVPSAWICAEEDRFFDRPLRRKVEATLRRRQSSEVVEHEFKEYTGTVHGFVCQPELTIVEKKKAYEWVFEQTVQWFSKTLPVP